MPSSTRFVLFSALLLSLTLGNVALASPQDSTTTTTEAKTKPKGKFRLPKPPKKFALPILTMDSEIYDWGTVIRGTVVEHTFTVRNSGEAPLDILEVKPQCGCTAVDKPADPIPPGGSAKLTLKVDTKRFKGPLKKTAAIRSNATKQPLTITMQGTVEPLFAITPENPKITIVRGAETPPFKISVKRVSKQPAEIVGIDCKSTIIAPTLKEIEPGSTYDIDVGVALNTKGTRSYYYERLKIKAKTGDEELELPLRVTVVVQDRISLKPKSAYFPRKETDTLKIEGAPTLHKVIDIRSLGGESHQFKILDVENKTVNFKHRLDTQVEGKIYQLHVMLDEIPPGTQRTVREHIVIKTNDPDHPELKITTMALFGR